MGDLKNREKISTTIRKDLIRKLETLNNNTKVPKSKLYDEALELLFNKREDDLR